MTGWAWSAVRSRARRCRARRASAAGRAAGGQFYIIIATAVSYTTTRCSSIEHRCTSSPHEPVPLRALGIKTNDYLGEQHHAVFGECEVLASIRKIEMNKYNSEVKNCSIQTRVTFFQTTAGGYSILPGAE